MSEILRRVLKTMASDGDSHPSSPQMQPSATPNREDMELLDAYSRAVMNVVETVSPGVVSITGEQGTRESGQGSGFIVSPDGFAITNSHVVSGRRRLSALTTDGDRLSCEVVGDDPSTDLALLRLAGNDLPHVTLGDSDGLRVGQLVIAMGSPLGLQSTVSTGVVSGVGRSMRAGDGRLIENIIQHAAPINPGNSGGPLIDSRGRVVGVNTAIIAFAQGIGFAVPSNTVQWVISEVLAHGQVRRRQLGIVGTTAQLTRESIIRLDLVSESGVLVVDLDRAGIGFQQGIREGDMIVSINDRIVTSVDDLHRFLSRIPIESTVELIIVREGRLQAISW